MAPHTAAGLRGCAAFGVAPRRRAPEISQALNESDAAGEGRARQVAAGGFQDASLSAGGMD